MPGPDIDFWQDRFARDQTPWDRGAPHPQLETWLREGTLDPKHLDGPIAVPGCGRGHELLRLAEAGFEAIGLDYAPLAVAQSRGQLDRIAGPQRSRVIEADVLRWRPPAPLPAVYEQTCLCALHPDHWTAYAAQLHAWLRPGGRLFALFMQARREGAGSGFVEGPPYHSDIHAMRALFPEPAWRWPKPPYPAVPHPSLAFELAVVLERR